MPHTQVLEPLYIGAKLRKVTDAVSTEVSIIYSVTSRQLKKTQIKPQDAILEMWLLAY